jgi:hypothetical protein
VTATLLGDREIVQAMVGRAQALHHPARAFLCEAMTGPMAAVDAGDENLLSPSSRRVPWSVPFAMCRQPSSTSP